MIDNLKLISGGGISIKRGSKIFIAPSGVQKERMQPNHLYVLDESMNIISEPREELKFKPSQCTPLFFNAFSLRNAMACIHTHSQNAVMVTLLTSGM